MTSAIQIPGLFFIGLRSSPNLALGIVNGQAALVWRNTNDPSQLWQICQLTLVTDQYFLVNAGTGGRLVVGEYGHALTTATDGTVWNIPGGIGNEVIRVGNNHEWNLNALGNGPYDVGTPVSVWNWTRNGAPNQSWQITNINNLPNPSEGRRYVIACGRSALAVSDGDLGGHSGLACSSGAATPQSDLKKVYFKVEWSNGFALRSAYNSKYIYFSGPNQALAQSASLSMRTLWNLLPIDESKVRGPLRSALDTTQNFNVLGAPEDNNGAAVGTWEWGGGETNEIWSLVAT